MTVVQRAAASASLPAPIRQALERHVREQIGLVFPPLRSAHFDAAVARAVTTLDVPDATVLLMRVQQHDPLAMEALAIEMTVGETYVLRDAGHFEFAAQVITDAAKRPGPIRLWSAGCATGEEAWSLAITAVEALGEAAYGRVEVLGTDLNPAFLRRAGEGLYGPWSFRRVPSTVQHRWFEPDGRSFRVRPELRRMVSFRPLNLMSDDPAAWPREIRVAFCRNVLIYFDADGLVPVASHLGEALALDGWLVSGPSDPILPHGDGLEIVQRNGMTAYHRLGAGVERVAPPMRGLERARARRSRPGAPRAVPVPLPRRETAPRPGIAPATTRPDAATDATRARKLADEGQHAAARALLDTAIGHTPLDAGLYVLRASVLQASGDATGAGADADRAVLLDRTLAVAHVAAATARLALGDPAGAGRALRTARKLLLDAPPGQLAAHGGGATVGELRAHCDQLQRALARPRAARRTR